MAVVILVKSTIIGAQMRGVQAMLTGLYTKNDHGINNNCPRPLYYALFQFMHLYSIIVILMIMLDVTNVQIESRSKITNNNFPFVIEDGHKSKRRYV